MSHSRRVLVIEDDPKIARFIELELNCEGYQVAVASDGVAGLIAARETPPDLIILDRMLPELDGMEVCRRIRQTSTIPILMLTAKAAFHERVEGLDAGANDYIVKPFNLDELLARVRVQMRLSEAKQQKLLQFADVRVNPDTREVWRGQELLMLAPREFDLLQCLMKQPNQAIPRARIMELVWGWNFEGDNNVLDVCMHGLRDKLERPGQPKLIQTLRGIGYILKQPA